MFTIWPDSPNQDKIKVKQQARSQFPRHSGGGGGNRGYYTCVESGISEIGFLIDRVTQHLDPVNILGPIAAPHPSMKINTFSGAFGH